MKFVSTVSPEYKVGQVDDEIIADARAAGLPELGITAMVNGDRRVFKAELEKLAAANPGSVWACMVGFPLWFNAADEGAKRQERYKLEREVGAFAAIRY